MDLSDPVPDRQAVDVFLILPIAESAFESYELALLKGPGEFGEIAPGEDAVPFGAGHQNTTTVFSIDQHRYSQSKRIYITGV
jgi:hypothetical protein